jgi:polysaccharide biosynthesis transport protein
MNLSRGNLEADWQKRSIAPADIGHLVRRHIVPLIVLPLVYLVAGFFYIIYATPIYTATATIEFNIDTVDPTVLDAALTSHIASLRSPEVTSQVIDRFGFDTSTPLASGRLTRTIQSIRAWLGIVTIPQLTEEEARAIVIDRVAGSLETERYGLSSIVLVRYYALEPRLAAEVANAYVDIYTELLRERMRASASRQAVFIQERITDVQEQAASSLQDVQRIRSEALESGGFENLDARLARLTEARAGIDEQVVALTTRLTLLAPEDDIVALEEAALQFEGGLQLVTAYANSLQTLERFRARNSSSDALEAMEASAALLREDVMRAFARERSRLEQELKILTARRENIDNEIGNALFESSRRNWSRILIQEHQAGVFQNIYADYLSELEAVYAQAEFVPLRVMAYAQARFEPDSPNYKLVLILSLFLGIAFGVGVAVLREWQLSQRNQVAMRRGEAL